MDNIPEELISKIIMLSVPNYFYMSELKQVHNLIHKFSEDYYDFSPEVYDENCDISHKFGLHKWFEHARAVRDETRGPTELEYYLEMIENRYGDDDY